MQMKGQRADRRVIAGLTCALLAGLALKFLWPLLAFDVPLGYDAGINRYLFVTHAEGFPPFVLAALEPWARDHPLGLFFFTTLLLRAGVPVEWLTGWMWNMMPIILAVLLALGVWRKHGTHAALGTLAAAILSVAYFDGFAAMYWKTFASLCWCVLAYNALERRSWLAVLFGIAAVATHHQTGLLFALSVLSWIVLPAIPGSRSTHVTLFKDGIPNRREMIGIVGGGIVLLIVGLLAYLPVWQEAIVQHLPALLGRSDAAGGTFLPASYYLRVQAVVLLLGAYGLWLNVRRERWTLWQLSVVWSLLFIVFRWMFYRRFFLQLDFFLMPFVGIAIADLWHRAHQPVARGILLLALVFQLIVTQRAVVRTLPLIDSQTFAAIQQAAQVLPPDAYVLGLENESVVFLRGWLPHHQVGGPGLFASSWSYEQWTDVLLGSHAQRAALLSTLPQPAYAFVSPRFLAYYKENSRFFTQDACITPTEYTMLFRITCPDVHD